ncbi:MAG: type IV pili methyl-accepting chemotaxis transducer N-terminal domain-containing protein [Betaproteobacteria bacterium]|nr:type IV pili methyl-accepting chemotaxis transducer N-terminal domain-containing protein [Betaproteobacteria bacterium]MBP6188048.1 type IV pili methyl-accepting chemotaxis transducer N-terminal domain-containing protein [Azonexus sp.]MBP6201789.1 type IV pili methyl-accepting chemotaxis transducer N-terminal domain-containing protein [Azonexus sp.]
MLSFKAVRQAIRVVFLLVACSLLTLSQGALAAGKEGAAGVVAGDIVSAGRLRMQSQRLAKLYQQAGMGLNATQAMQQITVSAGEIDSEFGRLGASVKKPNVRRVLTRCDALWQEMRAALKQAPGPASAERVNQLADELMIHTGKLSMLIEAEGETPVGRLIDLSSRLNMLSQRLARLYLLAQGGNLSQGVVVDIEQARKEFSTGLGELDTARENSPASRDAIGLAKNQWIFFESAINRLSVADRGEGKAVQNVATSSERIAQVLDLASAQYARDYSEATRPLR